MKKKSLIAFDFDHTIIDDNSDVRIQSLAENGHIPEHIRKLYKSQGWILYMNHIFNLIHEQGITPRQILDCMLGIRWTQGMKELLTNLDQDKYELIIISDSNSVFIDEILRGADLKRVFARIFTNSAEFDDKGCLHVTPYHYQDWCNLSTQNMCKGDILCKYVSERKQQGVEFRLIGYVGDGTNDLCPSLRLSESDIVFAREGYALLAALQSKNNQQKLNAVVIPWGDGNTIRKHLSN